MPKSSESFVPTEGSDLGPRPEDHDRLRGFLNWLSVEDPDKYEVLTPRELINDVWYTERVRQAVEYNTEYRALWVKWRMLGEP